MSVVYQIVVVRDQYLSFELANKLNINFKTIYFLRDH